MKRTEAILKGTAIGEMIMNAVAKIANGSMQDLPLLSMLPWLKLRSDVKAGKDIDFERLVPECYEVLIFGSTAMGERDEVGDLDMIVLDNGFFSDFFTRDKRGTGDDMYGELEGNIEVFFEGFLGIPESVLRNCIGDLKVDLHVLPVEILRSQDIREKLSKKHKDPDFLKNAFSALLRYEHRAYSCDPISIGELEHKYAEQRDLGEAEYERIHGNCGICGFRGMRWFPFDTESGTRRPSIEEYNDMCENTAEELQKEHDEKNPYCMHLVITS